MQEESLKRRHGIKLIATSVGCEKSIRENRNSALPWIVEGDAMAADVQQVTSVAAGDPASDDNFDTRAKNSKYASHLYVEGSSNVHKGTKTPADVVAQHLAAAAQAAAHAAGAAAGTMGFSKTVPTSSSASNIKYFPVSSDADVDADLSEISPPKAGQKQFVSTDLASPTHWFIADDERSHVRYIVIQGSDNIDHWRVNLTFDPVQFEDPGLGVKAHRGVYHAACQLYDRFLPLIEEHINAHPSATIAFTGHSLGGSLGTMLMMMYLRRGVLTPANLAPVHTFGAPAVFCGGETCCGSCPIDQKQEGVLQKLGLPHNAVKNVIMHKDIVPRAFACDYTLVADFLKSVHGSFREHHCLSGNRRVMFNSIGQTLILQPDETLRFVNGEGYHPLLPLETNLFALKYSSTDNAPLHLQRDDQLGMTNSQNEHEKVKKQMKRVASSSEEAFWELMNNPHPLDILGDAGAYGDNGTISRYHNPDNYTRALGRVLKSRGHKVGGIVASAKAQGVLYRPTIDKGYNHHIMHQE